MDYSSLTESQQQQQYQQQYQPQDQQQQQQAYDPAQAQAYEAYYAYHQQQYDASAYHQQYYPHDYAAAAAAYQAAPQPDPNPAPAPAPVPQPPAHDSSQIHGASAHGYAPPQDQQESSYQVPTGLNSAAAAAVAALSQLTQFAGTMDAAERAMAGMQERQRHGKGGGMVGPSAGGPLHHHYHHPQHHPRQHQMQHGSVPIRTEGGGITPYRGGRGGGRRGGGPIRGGSGSRGNFGHHPPRQDGGTPSLFRGRGRGRMGRGGGRRFNQSAPEMHQPYAAPAPTVDPSSATELVQAPGQALSQAPLATAVTAPFLPGRPLLPRAWCDICRVDCNSLEILEQHKNGKRHKKTVQRFEERQAQQKLIAELQAKDAAKPEMPPQRAALNKAIQVVEVNRASGQVSEASKSSAASESILAATFSAQVGEVTKASGASENMPTAVSTAEQNMEPDMQSQTIEGQYELPKVDTLTEPLATETPSSDAPVAEVSPMEGSTRRPRVGGYDQFDRRRGGGPKRKMMTFGRGGKRLRSFEPVRSRGPREQPRVCTLCNVMCDTLAVFECHLSGKKHISKIKRFKGQDTVYGPITVYIPPNQPSAYPTQGLEPLFYGLKSHEMLQQEAYSLSGLQGESYGIQQADHGEQARDAEGEALDSQAMESVEHPEGEVVPTTEGQETLTLDPENKDAVRDFGAQEPIKLPIESVDVTANLETEIALPIAEDVGLIPEYGASFANDIVVPGLDAKVEEPGDEECGKGEDMALH